MPVPLSDSAGAMRESPAHVLILSDDDMPLDQAIYIPQVGERKPFVAGVRGGYLYKFSLGGSRLSSSRFTVPTFQDASICYDPIHDKIFCSFWNAHGFKNQYEGSPPPDPSRRVYRIDPATFAVEASVRVFSPAFHNDELTFGSGPQQIIFNNGQIYGSCAPLFKVDPVSLAVTLSGGSPSDWPSLGWNDFAVDAARGLVWVASAGDEQLGCIDIATFSDLKRWDAGDTFVAEPYFHDYGLVQPDLSGGLFSWATFGPGYGYIAYEGGCVRVPSLESPTGFWYWMVLANMPPNLLALYADFECNVTPSGVAIGSPYPIQQRFDNQADAEAASAGWATSLDTGGLGTFNAGVKFNTFFNNPFNFVDFEMTDQVKVRLVQTLRYVAGSELFVPFGCAYCSLTDKIYVTTHGSKIKMFDPASALAAWAGLGSPATWVSIDIGDANAFPFRIRYNPFDHLLYLPTYKSNKVLTIDPVSNLVKTTYTGFDSPFDCVFVPPPDGAGPENTGKVFAVQHGNTPLKLVKS